MSALQDYRRYYPPACDELTEDELREIAPIIRQMQIDTSRIIQKLHQVQRLWERRALAASDANAAQLKTKIPQICKTMTSPSESRAFLEQAVEAYKRGPEALRRLAVCARAAGRLEF